MVMEKNTPKKGNEKKAMKNRHQHIRKHGKLIILFDQKAVTGFILA